MGSIKGRVRPFVCVKIAEPWSRGPEFLRMRLPGAAGGSQAQAAPPPSPLGSGPRHKCWDTPAGSTELTGSLSYSGGWFWVGAQFWPHVSPSLASAFSIHLAFAQVGTAPSSLLAYSACLPSRAGDSHNLWAPVAVLSPSSPGTRANS